MTLKHQGSFSLRNELKFLNFLRCRNSENMRQQLPMYTTEYMCTYESRYLIKTYFTHMHKGYMQGYSVQHNVTGKTGKAHIFIKRN